MTKAKLLYNLEQIYDQDTAISTFRSILTLIDSYHFSPRPSPRRLFDQKDVVLISYGDMVTQQNQDPLKTLGKFLHMWVRNTINTTHILPFFPYSSDEGFSVIDFKTVNPELGTWEDISTIGREFKLMVDLVANHVSSQSGWFNNFKSGIPPFDQFFIKVKPDTDLSDVFRPRTSPLLTKIDTDHGANFLWTTFSSDQIDLNYKNPRVLLEMLDALLLYITAGAEFIRLDAIAYIWKQIGTSCIHLPQVHSIVRCIHEVLNLCAPHVKLVTETNVPHEKNISYFGDGTDEAQLVYNFSLPPLVLHAFQARSAIQLSQWASTLSTPTQETTFFNFLSSHDGIGITPAVGILTPEQIGQMVKKAVQLGGEVSYKKNSDGSQSPYELNINYFDAMGNPETKSGDLNAQIDRFITSQAIMLALKGIPGIYFHSLFGSRGWKEGVRKTGNLRSINRERLGYQSLVRELADPTSLRSRIFFAYQTLLEQRIAHPAFHPNALQEILFLDDRLFSVKRISIDSQNKILCLHNVSADTIQLSLNFVQLDSPPVMPKILFGETSISFSDIAFSLEIPEYSTIWLDL